MGPRKAEGGAGVRPPHPPFGHLLPRGEKAARVDASTLLPVPATARKAPSPGSLARSDLSPEGEVGHGQRLAAEAGEGVLGRG